MNDNDKIKTTDFGFRQVREDEKAKLVEAIFNSVVKRYDLMNDLMSFGLHRLWKLCLRIGMNVKPGDVVLDVAAGTGDLALALFDKVGSEGKVILTDINHAMLDQGRKRITDLGKIGRFEYIQADAEALPFKKNQFDFVTISFGLRNVTNKALALKSMFDVLKPGGRIFVLEFSHPQSKLLKKLYDLYSFNLVPRLGKLVAKDKASYQYLVESIRRHPDQESLKKMMETAGFEDVVYQNMSGGIVALHEGYKY